MWRRSSVPAARPRLAVAVAAVLAVPACFAAGGGHRGRPALVLPAPPVGAPGAPGPAPRHRAFDAVAVNARCEGCHADIASEWRASLHRQSHTDPVYRSQFEREPFAFCTGCHAPEADPSREVPEPLSRLGVGCVTCHVAGDRVLAAPGRPTDHDGEHHPLTRTADFAGPAACGGCHEFAFPGARPGRDPLLMQSTMREHAASARAADRCASCHMPEVTGPGGSHRSHTFSASRDEAFVRSAVRVTVKPFEDETLTIELRPGLVGHAFPTGDMLRRLTLEIDVTGETGAVVEHHERHLGRRFGFARSPGTVPRRILLGDDRVGVAEEPVVLTFTARRRPPRGRLDYTLRYERVADPGGLDRPPVVEGSIVLAAGSLP